MRLFQKHILSFCTALAALTTSGFDSFSQDRDGVIEKISARFEKFTEASPQEKIHLHFDKPFYIPGETIWYKAYLLNGAANTPSSVSGIIYAELLDKNGEVIHHQILKADQGFASGEFLLPDSLLHGKYQARAYTQWMRNFDPEFFFTKELWVFDPRIEYDLASVDSARLDSAQTVIDLSFFPEGGNLVSGITSKVAFKACTKSGESIDVKGEIRDQDGQMIIPFESFHLGMGAFILKPEKGKTYFANLSQGGESAIPFKIPEALEEGLVLTVDHSSSNSFRIVVQANDTYLHENSGKVFILVQAAGKIYSTLYGDFNKGPSLNFAIPKENLPSGIVQITLFNADGKPECERLIFINHHDALRVKIETDKKNYLPREEVLLKLSVSDYQGNPVQGNFSLAVTDAHQLVRLAEYEDNILTNLILTSELKGKIEEPGFYFLKDNPDSETALDYLMLTQGWRRFLWKEILRDTLSGYNFDMEKQSFHRKGLVVDPSNDSPLSLTMLSVLMLKEGKSYSRYTNQEGVLDFYINAGYGKESLFFDAADAKGQRSKFKIILEKDVPEYHFAGSEEFSLLSPEINNCLQKRKEQAQIESSFSYSAGHYSGSGADSLINDPAAGTNRFPVTADYTVTLEEFNAFVNMTEVFREVVHYVSVEYKKGENKTRVYSSEYMRRFDHSPLFLVDGLPSFNKTYVLNLDPGEVETIEVINSIAKIRQYGFMGMNGVVSINTKHGNTTSDDMAEHAIIDFQACYHSREFYSPDYDNSPKPDKSKPDLRSLLYWNPMVVTDSNGEASLSFYNTDNITSFDIRCEGISIDGTPGLAEYEYQTIPQKKLP